METSKRMLSRTMSVYANPVVETIVVQGQPDEVTPAQLRHAILTDPSVLGCLKHFYLSKFFDFIYLSFWGLLTCYHIRIHA